MAIQLDNLIDKVRTLIKINYELREENFMLQKKLLSKEQECFKLNQRIKLVSKKISEVLSIRQ
ncbi:MAG: hypothetical protein CBD16_01770 [Betaproteobacteria bacterium TMED156]|nr:MAG: hypothetical protein CBD16_01770 [Betaproteobacteria bacterium TMED156]|tara:strand:- start:2632 stop:2820 length:189 start_codon:yes stop_codon:yes gene_type:complete